MMKARSKTKSLILVVLFVSMVALTGCGQKGDLYFPASQTALSSS